MPKNMLNVELISGDFNPIRGKVEFYDDFKPAGILERPIHARARFPEYFIF